jgi:hypothetical protein
MIALIEPANVALGQTLEHELNLEEGKHHRRSVIGGDSATGSDRRPL